MFPCVIYSFYKQLKIISAQLQHISCIRFCCIVFWGKKTTQIFFQRKKVKKQHLNDLNEIETKFKQHYKEKSSIFIVALKLDIMHFD